MRHLLRKRKPQFGGAEDQGRGAGLIPKVPSFHCTPFCVAGQSRHHCNESWKPTRAWPLAMGMGAPDLAWKGNSSESWDAASLVGERWGAEGRWDSYRPGLWRRLTWLQEAQGGHSMWLGKSPRHLSVALQSSPSVPWQLTDGDKNADVQRLQ